MLVKFVFALLLLSFITLARSQCSESAVSDCYNTVAGSSDYVDCDMCICNNFNSYTNSGSCSVSGQTENGLYQCKIKITSSSSSCMVVPSAGLIAMIVIFVVFGCAGCCGFYAYKRYPSFRQRVNNLPCSCCKDPPGTDGTQTTNPMGA